MESNSRIKQILRDIADLEPRLSRLKTERDNIQRSCSHTWGAIEDDPIHTPGYQFQGDPEGTMGIDRQLPFWVESKTIREWKRTCTNCAKVEATRQTKKKSTQSTFGLASEQEVPWFYDRY